MYDMRVTFDKESNKKLLQTLCRVGDYLTFDVVDIEQASSISERTKKMNHVAHIASYEDRHYGAYGFNWPYFCYATKYNRIFVLNAFNPDFIQCYDFPLNVQFISRTFLSDTHDLYAICQTTEDNYELFNIDLDSSDPCIKRIFKYSFEQVGGQLVKGFHVRGSSHKEKINISDRLIVYILHGNTLYQYVEGNDKLNPPILNAYNMYYMSDQTFFFTSIEPKNFGEEQVDHSTIMMVETLPGQYKMTHIYEDLDHKTEILNFGVDNTRNRLIILTGKKNHRGKREKFIQIFDVNGQKTLYKIKVTDKTLIGRLKTNLYNFVEGHIYFGNSVIKIRYDLIDEYQKTGRYIPENQLFDIYTDVLDFEDKVNWQV